jgi:hypothetical protein
LKIKERKSFPRNNSIRIEGENLYFPKLQEMDLINDLAGEGMRLVLLFNGMQQRVNQQPPVALFTDNKTKTTFGVEPGQNIRSKLFETRKKFRSFKDQLER